jgi:phenylacetate-CoA ligase
MVERSQHLDLDWVTLGAENVTPAQLAVIQDAFRVRPIQHYGMTEAVANISQWPDGMLRVDEDFAYTEFASRPDGLFDVVGTNFTNRAFPLIRYRVGDLVEVPNENGATVKFGRRVLQIDGRLEDYVVTKDGARVGRLDHIFKDCVNVREAQIIQERVGYIRVNVVANATYSISDERLLEHALRHRFGDRMHFEICRVDTIQRTARGKLRLVVSK